MDWKALIGSVAPTLATALGGPLAGMATKAIASKLLGNENAPLDAIKEAIVSATPDDLIKLKEVDTKFKTKMAEIGVDLETIAANDRAILLFFMIPINRYVFNIIDNVAGTGGG